MGLEQKIFAYCINALHCNEVYLITHLGTGRLGDEYPPPPIRTVSLASPSLDQIDNMCADQTGFWASSATMEETPQSVVFIDELKICHRTMDNHINIFKLQNIRQIKIFIKLCFTRTAWARPIPTRYIRAGPCTVQAFFDQLSLKFKIIN